MAPYILIGFASGALLRIGAYIYGVYINADQTVRRVS